MNVLSYNKEFKVLAVSSNTNSFGLYQMILASKDGEAYKTHASMYNVKKEGEFMSQTIRYKEEDNKVLSSTFNGCEMTTKLPQVPKDVLNEMFQ